MKRPQLISAGSLNRMLQAAKEALGRRDLQQSIELLERAHRLDPANSKILLQLGRTHALCYQFAKAENCFERAVRVAPNKVEILAAAGRHAVADRSIVQRYSRHQRLIAFAVRRGECVRRACRRMLP